MNSRRRARRLIEQGQGAGEIQVWVLGDQAGDRQFGYGLRHQDRAGPGVLHFVGVFGVGQKGQFAGGGVLHAGHTGDLLFAVADQAATQGARDFAEFHDLPVKPLPIKPPAYRTSIGGNGLNLAPEL